MIPLRIKLKGFLSYKDEQEICFDGASLWMLAGCNGVFSHHRCLPCRSAKSVMTASNSPA